MEIVKNSFREKKKAKAVSRSRGTQISESQTENNAFFRSMATSLSQEQLL